MAKTASDRRELLTILWKSVLESYAAQYSEQNARWVGLDQKAQATIVGAGVFIGGIFALLRQSPSAASPNERSFMAATVLVLVLSVGFCLAAMRVRPVADAPAGDAVRELAVSVAGCADESELKERYVRMLGDHCALWRAATAQVEEHLLTKAWYLGRGQWALFFALVMVAMMTVAGLVIPDLEVFQ